MPLTEFQRELARLLSVNRTEDSHLAGGAAIHFQPNSKRFSSDLDYFHDSEQRVASAFSADKKLLTEHGYGIAIELQQPGYVRAGVVRGNNSTKVEWAHDTAWRFLPVEKHRDCGFILSPIDLGVNKLLALAGRDEPRDFLDLITMHEQLLPLGALCWAATGKDPGFTPLSLLELLKRRGKYRAEDFRKLLLAEPVDLHSLKQRWLEALETADEFIRRRPPEEIGCLYYSTAEQRFVAPESGESVENLRDIKAHYGGPGGVMPLLK